MSLLALIPGLLLPAFGGWLGLRLLEGHSPVLLQWERWLLGCMLGLAYGMFIVFLGQITVGLPLSFLSFLGVFVLSDGVLLILFLRRPLPWKPDTITVADSHPLSRNVKIIFSVLLAWIVLKTIIAAVTFLLLVPTFLDDSLDNWNLRGKVFYETKALTLVLPNEDPATSPLGVSAYPPSLPMMKAWLADIAGNWNDPLVNSIHVLWYVASLVLIFSALRRRLGLAWALTGSYLLGSLPLFLMHGTNTYADCFMAAHVFAAVSMLFSAFSVEEGERRRSFLRIGAVALGILPFIKNEGLIVYLPPLLLLSILGIIWFHRTRRIEIRETLRSLITLLLPLVLVAVPWLLFKWSHGLSFGNAKPFSSFNIGWQPNVLFAMTVNTVFEGNWLLLFPFFFALLLWRWKKALTTFSFLTLFFLIVYVGQAMLYLFTSLSIEALKQTGYARGLIHLVPTVVFLTVLLLHEIAPPFIAALRRKE